MDENQLICNLCQLPLEKKRVDFSYLGHQFFTDVFCCPKCGEVFLPEELVKGRMTQVETELEDK